MSGKVVKPGLGAALLVVVVWLFCLPRQMFGDVSYSTVVVDRDNRLLGARLSADGQWRFPPTDSVPYKYKVAVVEFEDHHFYHHPGVNLQSMCRAMWQNVGRGRVVSGGSTITMQTIRLHRRKPRRVMEKLVEMFMATRLELRCSKDEILALYAAHAPFGGNVVGLKAAMWRYFGTDGTDLSWAEAATLAVLPNSPAKIHLSSQRDKLLRKRNKLLLKLYESGRISRADYMAAIEEPLMGKPYPMPQHAVHLVDRCAIDPALRGSIVNTDIDLGLQSRVSELLDQWCADLRLSGINDLAAVVIDVNTSTPVVYCGNSDMACQREGKWVDIATAPRSSGSTLKPLLYYAALRDGVMMPSAIIPDIPTDFGGFSPKNFDASYSGAIEADKAIALSLNIPAVYLLRDYGVAKFAGFLKDNGFAKSLVKPASNYGYTLILGGAEVTLLELASAYASMVRGCGSGDTDSVAFHYMLKAMLEIPRTDGLDWHRAVSSRAIAWKTGTSYGSRDAWAVGLTPEYVVAVWAGNADGSGVPGMTGASVAGPVMFDVFDHLPPTSRFAAPSGEQGAMVRVCRHSGYRAGRHCDDTEMVQGTVASQRTPLCPYCKDEGFSLPPSMGHYYSELHPEYHATAHSGVGEGELQIVYPTEGSVISVARQLDGTPGPVVCSAAHSAKDIELFWHLDGLYLGSTTHIHQLPITLDKGHHTLSVVDARGCGKGVEFVVR